MGILGSVRGFKPGERANLGYMERTHGCPGELRPVGRWGPGKRAPGKLGWLQASGWSHGVVRGQFSGGIQSWTAGVGAKEGQERL